MGKVKLALVGCGFISDVHEKAFRELQDKIEVVACCDIVIERAQKMAEFLDCPLTVEDYRELMDVADAFLLALPHDLHYEIGMDCLNHKKHVLMEKPLALSEDECLGLIRAAEENHVKLMVAYIMRYHPMIAKLKEIIDRKEYGELFQMSIWTEQYTYYEDEWTTSAARLGGGQFFSHGCHYVDLLLWYLGKPIKGAHMGTNLCTPWMEMEGTSNAIFEFEGGRLAYHFGTWGAKGTRHSYAINTFFEDGMVECCLNEGKMYLHKSSNLTKYFEKSDQEILIFECEPTSHLPKYEIEHFADCILEDKEPLTSGAATLQGHRVIWRMYEAEKKNVIADLRGLALDDPWDRTGAGKLPV